MKAKQPTITIYRKATNGTITTKKFAIAHPKITEKEIYKRK